MPTSLDRTTALRLADVRDPWCVSVYADGDSWLRGDRPSRVAIAQIHDALEALDAAGAPRSDVDAVRERLTAVTTRYAHPAVHGVRGVAILVTPRSTDVIDLPSTPSPSVTVGDRFRIGPYVEATVNAPAPALLLALSENRARLIGLTPPSIGELDVPQLPHAARAAVPLDLRGDREGATRDALAVPPKERLRQYARAVRDAVEPVAAGRHALLVIAAAQPLASIYRAETEYPLTLDEILPGNHDDASPLDLADAAEPILRREARRRTLHHLDRFARTPARGRCLVDAAEVVAALRRGNVKTLLVDTRRRMPTAAHAFGREIELDLVDEAVRRALSTRAQIVCVEPGDLPSSDPLAAILRYPQLHRETADAIGA